MIVYQIWWRDAAEVSAKKLKDLDDIRLPKKVTYGEIIKETMDMVYIAKEKTVGDDFWDKDYDVSIIPKCLIIKEVRVGD